MPRQLDSCPPGAPERNTDTKECVQCTRDETCATLGRVCDTTTPKSASVLNRCVECLDDDGCAGSGSPHCDPATHACVACISNEQCSGRQRLPLQRRDAHVRSVYRRRSMRTGRVHLPPWRWPVHPVHGGPPVRQRNKSALQHDDRAVRGMRDRRRLHAGGRRALRHQREIGAPFNGAWVATPTAQCGSRLSRPCVGSPGADNVSPASKIQTASPSAIPRPHSAPTAGPASHAWGTTTATCFWTSALADLPARTAGCVECTDDDHCHGRPGGPVCKLVDTDTDGPQAVNTCVQCLDNADCTNPAASRCVANESRRAKSTMTAASRVAGFATRPGVMAFAWSARVCNARRAGPSCAIASRRSARTSELAQPWDCELWVSDAHCLATSRCVQQTFGEQTSASSVSRSNRWRVPRGFNDATTVNTDRTRPQSSACSKRPPVRHSPIMAHSRHAKAKRTTLRAELPISPTALASRGSAAASSAVSTARRTATAPTASAEMASARSHDERQRVGRAGCQ